MKFFNCHNKEGFKIDGEMSQDEENFNENLCTWEMVTGESGTFLRIFDIFTDLSTWVANLPPSLFLQSWYYDNATPVRDRVGSGGAPNYPNGFSLCSALLDQQVCGLKFWQNLNFCARARLYGA